MRIPVSIHTRYFMADKKALVDSGATDNFMHPNFTKRMGLGMKALPKPKRIFNIDNTTNKSGMMLRSVGCSVRRGRWGVCPECRQGVERICRAITKQVQRSDARIEVDVMHTWNECTE
jgi:hypothetical protein